ncbi:hypothetical protein UFOVP1204_45 [uncultured Caudovirales phage]|uniref:Uncharacterized protein n=1 Tax=uncultured Caudovirales phage TaxID=2100421 RepID=A0A6J5RC61_9CAUD|nr:hypothetical protein UFOVP473_56 [uncultured Caudovirales phage]CAB4176804.1 hypothetical protein UFOVP983_56 [uncultured Caudovirales phage]CAB4190115.1 hypothetical protein UFOVP1204_45 [uncultured Caudovirales phage]
MIRDIFGLTSLSAGFYAVWCATPADAATADWIDAQGKLVVGGMAIGWPLLAIAAIVLLTSLAVWVGNAIGRTLESDEFWHDDAPRSPEQRARDGGV